jgi:hypothetical protein
MGLHYFHHSEDAGWQSPRAALQHTPRSAAPPSPPRRPHSPELPQAPSPRRPRPKNNTGALAPAPSTSTQKAPPVLPDRANLPRIRTRWGQPTDLPLAAIAPMYSPRRGLAQSSRRNVQEGMPTHAQSATKVLAPRRPVKLPRFVIARGGVAFAFSPPAPKTPGGGSLSRTSPPAALIRLRKLRRDAHFRRLTKQKHAALARTPTQAACSPVATGGNTSTTDSRHMPSQRDAAAPTTPASAGAPASPFPHRLERTGSHRTSPWLSPRHSFLWDELPWSPAYPRSPHHARHAIHKIPGPMRTPRPAPSRVRVPPGTRRVQPSSAQRNKPSFQSSGASPSSRPRMRHQCHPSHCHNVQEKEDVVAAGKRQLRDQTPLGIAITGHRDCNLAVVGASKLLQPRPVTATGYGVTPRPGTHFLASSGTVRAWQPPVSGRGSRWTQITCGLQAAQPCCMCCSCPSRCATGSSLYQADPHPLAAVQSYFTHTPPLIPPHAFPLFSPLPPLPPSRQLPHKRCTRSWRLGALAGPCSGCQ